MSEKSSSNGLDGYVLAFGLGVAIGAIALAYITKPDELKAKVIETETSLKACQTSLSESDNVIKGMILNK